MRISNARLSALEEKFSREDRVDITIDYETWNITFHCNNGRKYIPCETAKKFHDDDNSVVKCVMGPYGSGKTTFNVMDLLIRACKMPRSLDGIRRCRTLIFRNTFDQLKRGVYDTWTQWFWNLGETRPLQGNKLEYYHTFNDGHGIIEWEIWFIPMESIKDPSKFKSFNATNALLNEVNELPRSVLDHLVPRLGRYPFKDEIDYDTVEEKYKIPIVLEDGKEVKRCPYWNGINGDTNPPDTRHYVYKLFEKERPVGYRMFKQPPGLIKQENGSWKPNPNCDNYGVGISEDYYLKQTVGHTEEYINVFCNGEYGLITYGKAVFPQYNDDIHSVEKIDFNPDYPVIVGLDGGFTPAAIFAQLVGGKLNVIHELRNDRMFLEEFVEAILLTFMTANLRGYEVIITGDPAITERETAAMEKLGLHLQKAPTNTIEPRVQSVITFLTRLGALSVSKKGCPELRAGFIGEYCFEETKVIDVKTGNAIHAEKPTKAHPVSDLHDGLQYIALHYSYNPHQDDDDRWERQKNKYNEQTRNEVTGY